MSGTSLAGILSAIKYGGTIEDHLDHRFLTPDHLLSVAEIMAADHPNEGRTAIRAAKDFRKAIKLARKYHKIRLADTIIRGWYDVLLALDYAQASDHSVESAAKAIGALLR